MKKIVLTIVFILLAVSALAFGSAFCDGWENGYKSGYCYGKGYGCVQPIAPVCPVPRPGEDNYQGGYNRGFIAGMNAQR